jgi:hypothetical protein
MKVPEVKFIFFAEGGELVSKEETVTTSLEAALRRVVEMNRSSYRRRR